MKNNQRAQPNAYEGESASRLHSHVQVIIPEYLWKKLLAYARLVNTEINGYGTVEIRGSAIRVTDIFILKQTVLAARAHIDGEDLATWLDHFSRNGGEAEAVCLQWHSHAKMSVFWSGVDDANIANLIRLPSLLVSLEVNHAGDCLCRVDVSRPLPLQVMVKPTIELEGLSQADMAQLGDEVASLVSTGVLSLAPRRNHARASLPSHFLIDQIGGIDES